MMRLGERSFEMVVRPRKKTKTEKADAEDVYVNSAGKCGVVWCDVVWCGVV